jgi:alkaline phosphatase D
VLDTRQYRSDQQRSEPFIATLGPAVQVRDDTMQFADDHTMIGAEQFEWLVDQVGASSAVWDVLAQQVYMMGANALPGADPPVVVIDTWDGYSGERKRLLESISPLVDNLVVITGDFHSAAVGELRPDPFDPTAPTVGVEFMASSISSFFFDDDPVVARLVSIALDNNPHLRFFDTRRGYTRCDVTPDEWTATFRAVVDPSDESSAVETITTWQILAGTPAVTELV